MSKRQAPGELSLVEQLVNTLDRESGHDELATPEALASWLADRGLLEPGARVRRADVARVVALREALRALLVANNGGAHPDGAVAELDRAAARAGVALRFGEGGAALVPSRGGVDAAIGRVLAAVADAMAAGTWRRLKACRSDACAWAFYDHTKNGSGRWCSMAVCGNRTKQRAYRARRAG